MAFADDEVGQLRLAGRGRRAYHHMRKQRAISDVDLVLGGEFADHLGAARRVGAVILDDDFDLAAVDAAGIVDQLDRCGRGLLVPAAIGGADAGAMRLEADLDRRRTLRLAVADEARRRHEAGGGGNALQRAAAIDPIRLFFIDVPLSVDTGISGSISHSPASLFDAN